jgi:hypothetical protein
MLDDDDDDDDDDAPGVLHRVVHDALEPVPPELMP